MYLIHMDFPEYDANAKTLPTIARVTEWKRGRQPEVAFGGFTRTGGYQRGASGFLEVAANKGDIVRVGQYDHDLGVRDYKWYVIGHNGDYFEVSLVEAWDTWDNRADQPTRDPLRTLVEAAETAVETLDLIAGGYHVSRDELVAVGTELLHSADNVRNKHGIVMEAT